MSKLQEIRAAVDELDAAKLAWDEREDPQLASITDAQYNRHHAAIANVDWEAIARLLLPVALAAEELRVDVSFVDENGRCISCGRLNTQNHHESCSVIMLFNALKGLDE